jgi:hypothetical protein
MRTTREAVGAALAVVTTSVGLVAGAPSADAATPYPPPPPHTLVSPCTPFALPVPDGWGGSLMAVNDSGTYIGGVQDSTGTQHGAFWTHTGSDPTSGYTLHLVDPPDAPGAELLDINASGVATGFSDYTGRAFVYNTGTGEFHLLPDFGAGGSYAWPRRINNAGVIAGGAYTADGTEYAATWAPPYTTATRVHVPNEEQVVSVTDPSTGQVFAWKYGSEATGVNDAGTVAVDNLWFSSQKPRRITGNGHFAHDLGSSTPLDLYSGVNPPVLVTASGRVAQLNTTGDSAFPFALDDTGLTVGDDVVNFDPYTTRPVYWKGGMEHDLGMAADAQAGRALNINGDWVTGGIFYPDGSTRSYVWTGGGALQVGQPLPGYPSSWAHLVNAKLGQFGGDSDSADGTTVTPTVWECPTGFTTR